MKHNISLGGLVNSNSGKITNSCVYLKKSYKDDKLSLYAKNSGSITRSLMILKGDVVDMYNESGVRTTEDIGRTSDGKKNGLDMDKDWKYVGGANCVAFNCDNWCELVKKKDMTVIKLKSTSDYLKFVYGVNKGNADLINAYIVLECDLDFKGKVIPMVADTREHAFAGVFDGNGHTIWNAVIKDKESTYNALFGYLKGSIVNLIFDGRVYGSANIAGLCGVNMGVISCSGAVVRLYVQGERTAVSGLVNTNEGTIRKCYSVIDYRYPIMPLIPIGAAAAAVIALGIIATFTIQTALDANRIYAAIETDDNQEKIHEKDNSQSTESTSGSNAAHRMSFTLNEKVTISLVSMECTINFENPSNSKNKVIIQLQIEDSNGERVTVATSKGVEPGYRLRKLSLSDAAYDVLSGREKQGYIVITPYDAKTEDRGAVQTELPVSIGYSN